jgi:hypothetical protein
LDVWRRNTALLEEKKSHEVEEFICNSCRFDHKDPADWVIERKFEKDSVINQKKYTRKLRKCNCY